MLPIRIACILLLAFAHANADAQTPPGTTPYWEETAVAQPTQSDSEPTFIKWIRGICIAIIVFIVIIVAIRAILWHGKGNTRPMTPEEIKASQERTLDTVSKMRMLQAMGRGDGDAIREEMKLIELRNIRRQNE